MQNSPGNWAFPKPDNTITDIWHMSEYRNTMLLTNQLLLEKDGKWLIKVGFKLKLTDYNITNTTNSTFEDWKSVSKLLGSNMSDVFELIAQAENR